MECDICARNDFEHVGMLCASCARTTLYLIRLEAARALLEKEALGRRVEAITDGSLASALDEASPSVSAAWVEEFNKVKVSVAKDKIREKTSAIDSVGEEIARMKEEIKRTKSQIGLRKTELGMVKSRLPTRQHSRFERVTDIITRGSKKFENDYHNTVGTKAFLCREAATLLRLVKQKRRLENGSTRDEYFIAGLRIPDLKDINNFRCTKLTAVLAAFSHLLVLVAFYLGVRLPAEITLPHRDYPRATINTPANSYLNTKTTFPWSGSALSLPGSPSASRLDVRSLSRPRPLFIGSDNPEEKITGMTKKDPAAFNFFLEAVSLLAWNTSWLIQTQGFTVGTESWDEACNIGRNLWQLILAPPQSTALPKTLSNKDLRQRQTKSGQDSSSSSSPGPNVGSGKLGEQSHSSAHTFLGGAARRDQGRGWKLTSYTVIADPLKKALLTEMNNAEWELLGKQDIDDGSERFDEADMIRPPALDGKHYDEARSILTGHSRNRGLEGVEKITDPSANNAARARGTTGWTKLKTRDNTTT